MSYLIRPEIIPAGVFLLLGLQENINLTTISIKI